MHTSKCQIIYSQLLQKITSKEYKEGCRLPTESALCCQFGVSRPVVRGALKLLKDHGYIESIRGSGSFVLPPPASSVYQFTPVADLHEAIQCMDYRIVLEGEIAYNAGLHRTERDILLLQETLESNHKNLAMDNSSMTHQSMDFHLAVAQAAHNRFYFQAFQILSTQILDSINQVSWNFQSRPKELSSRKHFWHSEILRAILIGDPVLAKTAMQMHLRRAKSNLVLQTQGKKPDEVKIE